MATSIKINTDSLTVDPINGIKAMLPHKTVEITNQPAEATDYILSNPDYAHEIQERVERHEKGKKTISVKPEDLP